MISEEAFVARFKVLYLHLYGETEQTHANP